MGQERLNLVPPCGLYCGACVTYIACERGDSERLVELAKRISKYRGQDVEVTELTCEGCLSSGAIALFCRECALRACAVKKGLRYCAQCPDVPCQLIIDFNNDGMGHHSEVIDNIRRQRDIGINAWLKEQDERWHCPQCGCAVDWYARRCPECDTALARQF